MRKEESVTEHEMGHGHTWDTWAHLEYKFFKHAIWIVVFLICTWSRWWADSLHMKKTCSIGMWSNIPKEKTKDVCTMGLMKG